MPSVYDYHHVELNKVGRGKKRISLQSADGGIKSVLTTPPTPVTPSPKANGVHVVDSANGSNGHSSNGSTPNSSRPSSRRGSRTEDTKTKLFGPPEDSPRRVRNLFKSTIFSMDSPPSSPQKVTPKSNYAPARRNPITGEILSTPTPVTPVKIPSISASEKSSGSSSGNGSIASSSSLSSIPSN